MEYQIQGDASMPYVYLTQEEIETWDWDESGELKPPKYDEYTLFADGTLYGSMLGSGMAEFICDGNSVAEYGL